MPGSDSDPEKRRGGGGDKVCVCTFAAQRGGMKTQMAKKLSLPNMFDDHPYNCIFKSDIELADPCTITTEH